MRIDSNPGAQPLPDSARTGNQTSSASPSGSAKGNNQALAGISSPLGEDQAQLSAVHAQIPAWVAQVSQLPETAQEKVDALRQAVINGTYQPSPDQVAGAIFANMVAKIAA